MESMPASVRRFLAGECGLPPETVGRLEPLSGLLAAILEVNDRLNLTRILDSREFWIKHVADSVSAVLAVPELASGAVGLLDIGSGAGFPLFPLVFLNPGVRALAVEPRRRRAAFLEQAAARLGVSARVRVAARQVLEAARFREVREAYHGITARAVGPAARLIRDAHPALAPGGFMVFYKTPKTVAAEFAAAAEECRRRGLALRRSRVFSLPEAAGERQFLVATRPAS